MLLCLGSVQAAEWDLKKNKKGITVETRSVPGETLKEFRGTMNITASLNSLTALVYDTDNAPKWMHDNKSLTLDEEISEQDRWYYLVNGVPWPLKTRDAYLHIESAQDPSSQAVTIMMSADPARKPGVKKKVRILSMKGGWTFAPKADGTVDVTYQLFINPGGKIPARLANIVVVDIPYNTMKDMNKMLATGNYNNTKYDWITEP